MGKKKTHSEFVKEMKILVGDEYTVLGKYKSTHTRILIKHNTCGHEYEVAPSSFLSGRRCPKHANNIKKTQKEFIDEVFSVYGNEYKVLGNYKSRNSKILIKHMVCNHEWMITPYNFLHEHGCPVCGGRMKKTQAQFEKEVLELVGSEYTILGEYKSNKVKILIRHNTCSHEYKVIPSSFINGGTKCPKCFITPKKNTERFKKEVYELVGNEYTILGEYKTNSTKILIRHNKCEHEWEISPIEFLRNPNRCPKCNKRMKKTTEIFKKEVFSLAGNHYSVLGEWKNSKTKILMKHNICGHEWEILPHNFLNGVGCPLCASSKGEKAISEYLSEKNIDFNTEFRIGTDKKRYDFKVDNLLFEFDGVQHFKKAWSGWKDKVNLDQQKANDKYKTELALFNGYKLVRISYTEMDNISETLDFIFNNELEDLNLFGAEYNERNY